MCLLLVMFCGRLGAAALQLQQLQVGPTAAPGRRLQATPRPSMDLDNDRMACSSPELWFYGAIGTFMIALGFTLTCYAYKSMDIMFMQECKTSCGYFCVAPLAMGSLY